MMNYHYLGFLSDPSIYALSESYWLALWQEIDQNDRVLYGWKQPWFKPLPPKIAQGNPIFSAVSPRRRRGIRLIQHEPTVPIPEIFAYLDTFGGPLEDPESVKELVISCALSDFTARTARRLMGAWVAEKPIVFASYYGDFRFTYSQEPDSAEAYASHPAA